MTVVTGAAHWAAAMPVAASALKRRAPSMWMGTCPAASATAWRPSRVHGAPQAGMCVFSMLTSDTVGWWYSVACRATRTSSGRSMPSVSSSPISSTPALSDAAPNSYATRCWRRPTRTAVPGGASTRTATWLAMTPDGTNKAAGLPTRSANASSSARTVGSSP